MKTLSMYLTILLFYGVWNVIIYCIECYNLDVICNNNEINFLILIYI